MCNFKERERGRVLQNARTRVSKEAFALADAASDFRCMKNSQPTNFRECGENSQIRVQSRKPSVYAADHFGVFSHSEFNMSAIEAVECPHCAARIRIKSANILGKKVSCPKCSEPFFASFGPLDLLWFFLAAGTAFKLGSGQQDEK